MKTILVIDDSMIIREMIKDIALQLGWKIAGEATNGQEAIDAYQRLQPDAVTLDLVMPDYDGLHALRGIRAIAPRARVLVVSAINQPDVLREAVDLGAADFVIKPFKSSRMRNALLLLASAPSAPIPTST
jgi:two-component system chemotaxis response regulator CheY